MQIHPIDNCAVALEFLDAHIYLPQIGVTLPSAIAQGHKFALTDIRKGEDIIKYGAPIGVATQDIPKGAHLHNHNMKTKLNDLLNYQYQQNNNNIPATHNMPKTFMGYHRQNGTVGTRNDIFIIPLVGCINGICRVVANNFEQKYKSQLSPDTRVIVLEHPYGCSQLGDDLQTTKKILQDFMVHPNAGAVLIVGLGCENNKLDIFLKDAPAYDANRIRYFNAQDAEDEVEHAEILLNELFINLQKDQRSAQPFSKLKIGLKCGGSDGFSGITANPLLGRFSDNHCANGGTTILTEVPEMFGAEHLLMQQAANHQIFNKTVQLINDFKDYYKQNNQPIYENPSPGNKEGGITTLEEKSLGCTQKAGHSPVTDVLAYGERSTQSGLQLLSGPGNDLVAVTALSAAGCQIVLFTTGRGTAFGGAVPTIKLSSNSQLAQKKKNWIDFNAGAIISEQKDINQLSEELAAFICDVAEGKYVSHERYNQFMISIFKTGVTL